MRIIINEILYWTWELPQTAIGFALLQLLRAIDAKEYYSRIGNNRVIMHTTMLSGVSLGKYLFVRQSTWPADVARSVRHEYGHAKQSRILGPLYLLIVGIPSVMNNVIGILEMAFFGTRTYFRNYYNHYPENWADRLGRITKKEREYYGQHH